MIAESSPTASTAPAASAAPAAPGATALGKDDFLKLLTAQLANQDPLQPVDNQAFVAQLAQFSSLEQLQGVSARLDDLLLATNASTQVTAASLVGKTVEYRNGVDASGKDVHATGQVQGVAISGDGVDLIVGGRQVKLSDLVAITQERNPA
jgi:flagellar basal-body rod modification protein FlgD